MIIFAFLFMLSADDIDRPWSTTGAITADHALQLGIEGGFDTLTNDLLAINLAYFQGLGRHADIAIGAGARGLGIGFGWQAEMAGRYQFLDLETLKLAATLAIQTGAGTSAFGHWPIPMVAIMPGVALSWILKRFVLDFALLPSVGIPWQGNFHFFMPGARFGFNYTGKHAGFFCYAETWPYVNFVRPFVPAGVPFAPISGVRYWITLGPQWGW